ncbi:response regulator transcription factor [Piscinibacter terrae]|uniref:DNA-binding response regulator n=1 Tax=Piscinibacter terrae TaxID=2496871 RepID=A0A3N7HX72_9BURK|nr:response regulator transcription factor [Albitalea terrae]RQP25661.1 DNA-binding response regulator [Albitalea terrae]
MIRCLLVDDDSEIRVSLTEYLQRFGMSVLGVDSGAQMRRAVKSETFDVVILDVMLPDDNGFDLCKWMRQQHRTPVIMLTAQGDPISRVVGLEIGADDYVAKPFEPRELVARINAVLRRAPGGEAAALRDLPRSVQFSGWSLDRLQRQLVSPSQVVVALSNAEFRLLTAFVDHAGRVLSRDQLVDFTVTPGVEVNHRSVDLAVSRLRQKLGDSPREPSLIRTVRGEGYLFDAKVSSERAA